MNEKVHPVYLVDINVIIWVSRNRQETLVLLRQFLQDAPLGCSALTISEVLCLAKETEFPRTEALLDSMITWPIGKAQAKLAARLMRHHGPGYVDRHLAASAFLLRIPIVTYHRRDFARTGMALFDTSGW